MSKIQYKLFIVKYSLLLTFTMDISIKQVIFIWETVKRCLRYNINYSLLILDKG